MSQFRTFLRSYWPFAVVFAVCVLGFTAEAILSAQGNDWMDRFLLVPSEVTASWQEFLANGYEPNQLPAFITLLSAAFLHADVEHIAMNLVFIWVFGSLVLRELGAIWFLGIFIFTAITGSVGQILLDPESVIPVLGASGALLGLEGVYFGMALRWRLPNPDVWPISHPIAQERLMIFAALGILLDISGILGDRSGVAFGAHIGGFIGGFVLGTTLIPTPKHATFQ